MFFLVFTVCVIYAQEADMKIENEYRTPCSPNMGFDNNSYKFFADGTFAHEYGQILTMIEYGNYIIKNGMLHLEVLRREPIGLGSTFMVIIDIDIIELNHNTVKFCMQGCNNTVYEIDRNYFK